MCSWEDYMRLESDLVIFWEVMMWFVGFSDFLCKMWSGCEGNAVWAQCLTQYWGHENASPYQWLRSTAFERLVQWIQSSGVYIHAVLTRLKHAKSVLQDMTIMHTQLHTVSLAHADFQGTNNISYRWGNCWLVSLAVRQAMLKCLLILRNPDWRALNWRYRTGRVVPSYAAHHSLFHFINFCVSCG